jgi:hypothetical protein
VINGNENGANRTKKPEVYMKRPAKKSGEKYI